MYLQWVELGGKEPRWKNQLFMQGILVSIDFFLAKLVGSECDNSAEVDFRFRTEINGLKVPIPDQEVV